jgi:hypothetical protein
MWGGMRAALCDNVAHSCFAVWNALAPVTYVYPILVCRSAWGQVRRAKRAGRSRLPYEELPNPTDQSYGTLEQVKAVGKTA